MKYISLTAMAEVLDTSPRTLKKRTELDGIPHIVYGRSLRYDPDEVKLYLKGVARAKIKKEPSPPLVKKRVRSKVTIPSKFAEAVNGRIHG